MQGILSRKHSWFTLVEILIAMTIFSVMLTMVFSIYFQITDTTRRMNASRILSETSREILERFSSDIRDIWVASWAEIDPNYDAWKEYNYTDSGSEFLNIKNGTSYVYGRKTDSGIKPCIDNFWWSTELTKTDPKIHCGLYLKKWTNYQNLIDIFVPEWEKRVKVDNTRFFVSGNENTPKKVTIIFRLSLIPRVWVSPDMLKNTHLDIQTTISERWWKK